jgi:GT2 family glycosyltransferase
MISIIICSSEPVINKKLTRNIEQTIGCIYELIVISNQNNRYSIFEAYNIGLDKSKFDFCCFMHQDILFHTTDWGQKVLNHFENNQIGLIGVAGIKVVTQIPSLWSDRSINNVVNIIQSDKKCQIPTQNNFSEFIGSDESHPVICLDGVWFCLNKSILPGLSFDEKYKGFHFYDMDICMQAQTAGKEVHVIHNVIIEHFSWGSLNKEWALNAFRFFSKWRRDLPIYTADVSKEILLKHETDAFRQLIKIINYYELYNRIFEVFILGIQVLGWTGVKMIFRYKKIILKGTKYLLFKAS